MKFSMEINNVGVFGMSFAKHSFSHSPKKCHEKMCPPKLNNKVFVLEALNMMNSTGSFEGFLPL